MTSKEAITPPQGKQKDGSNWNEGNQAGEKVMESVVPSTEPGARELKRMRLRERLLDLARRVFLFFW